MTCPHCNLKAPSGYETHRHCRLTLKRASNLEQQRLGYFVGSYLARALAKDTPRAQA